MCGWLDYRMCVCMDVCQWWLDMHMFVGFGTTFRQPCNICIPTHKHSCTCNALYYAAETQTIPLKKIKILPQAAKLQNYSYLSTYSMHVTI